MDEKITMKFKFKDKSLKFPIKKIQLDLSKATWDNIA